MVIRIVLGVLALVALLFAARLVMEARKSRQMAPGAGVVDGRLRECSARPNCVSSDGGEEEHGVEPLAAETDESWADAVQAIGGLDGVAIVEQSDDYLHATCRSRLLGFVDDLELHRRDGEIAVRSASRVGYSDLGANRRRVETIRALLRTP